MRTRLPPGKATGDLPAYKCGSCDRGRRAPEDDPDAARPPLGRVHARHVYGGVFDGLDAELVEKLDERGRARADESPE